MIAWQPVSFQFTDVIKNTLKATGRLKCISFCCETSCQYWLTNNCTHKISLIHSLQNTDCLLSLWKKHKRILKILSRKSRGVFGCEKWGKFLVCNKERNNKACLQIILIYWSSKLSPVVLLWATSTRFPFWPLAGSNVTPWGLKKVSRTIILKNFRLIKIQVHELTVGEVRQHNYCSCVAIGNVLLDKMEDRNTRWLSQKQEFHVLFWLIYTSDCRNKLSLLHLSQKKTSSDDK